jgi:hypothetical protein
MTAKELKLIERFVRQEKGRFGYFLQAMGQPDSGRNGAELHLRLFADHIHNVDECERYILQGEEGEQ